MIWLGRPEAQERDVLAAAGWDVRVIEEPRGARIGLRGGDRVAALLDLGELLPVIEDAFLAQGRGERAGRGDVHANSNLLAIFAPVLAVLGLAGVLVFAARLWQRVREGRATSS